jgi:myo-inositol 2-dehydrogenase/D-chiro-inositol 1-dehydrogenase
MALKIGVIGTGAIGQEHIRRLNTKLVGSKVVAVTDINLDSANKMADIYGGITVYKTYQEVVEDPNVDALVITSWGPVHAEQVLAAIKAGKPVFVEKPMATTAADGKKIVEAEIASGKQLVQVGFMRRYDAGYKMLKNVIDSGKIGAPLVLHCAHRNPTVPTSYVTYMAINDTAIHELDCLHWLINDEWTSAQVIMPRQTVNTHDKLKDPQILILTSAKGVRVVSKSSSTASMATTSSAKSSAKPVLPNCLNRCRSRCAVKRSSRTRSSTTGKTASSIPTTSNSRIGSMPPIRAL